MKPCVDKFKRESDLLYEKDLMLRVSTAAQCICILKTAIVLVYERNNPVHPKFCVQGMILNDKKIFYKDHLLMIHIAFTKHRIVSFSSISMKAKHTLGVIHKRCPQERGVKQKRTHAVTGGGGSSKIGRPNLAQI